MRPWSQDPEWDENAKEASDVQNEDDAFHEWEPYCQDSVEENSKAHDSYCEQSCMPPFEAIVRVVERNETCLISQDRSRV